MRTERETGDRGGLLTRSRQQVGCHCGGEGYANQYSAPFRQFMQFCTHTTPFRIATTIPATFPTIAVSMFKMRFPLR